jgi:hypothetical protein
MSAPKCAHDGESAVAAVGGAGGGPPPPPARRPRPADDDEANERRLKLTDVIGFVAQNGYAREASRCAGLNRETWRCIPAGLSAADADRVRRDHPLWQAIINLKQTKGYWKETRLGWAARSGHLARVCELCDWRADVEATDRYNLTPLVSASYYGHHEVVRELLSHGANVNAVFSNGDTPLISSSSFGDVEVVRVLLTGRGRGQASRQPRRLYCNLHSYRCRFQPSGLAHRHSRASRRCALSLRALEKGGVERS